MALNSFYTRKKRNKGANCLFVQDYNGIETIWDSPFRVKDLHL